MSAPDNGDPYRILRDATARTEMVLADHLENGNFAGRAKDAVRSELAAIRAARALAESRSKLAAPEMGGCVLDLSDPHDAALLRAVLALVMDYTEDESIRRDGVTITASACRSIRKRINAGVVRNCERRTEAGK